MRLDDNGFYNPFEENENALNQGYARDMNKLRPKLYNLRYRYMNEQDPSLKQQYRNEYYSLKDIYDQNYRQLNGPTGGWSEMGNLQQF